jgi:hypothetical protein
MKELNDFWNEIKKSTITFKDIEKLQDLLSKIFMRMKELEQSRDKWKEKYFKLKKR